jgi:hypothetical protein
MRDTHRDLAGDPIPLLPVLSLTPRSLVETHDL